VAEITTRQGWQPVAGGRSTPFPRTTTGHENEMYTSWRDVRILRKHAVNHRYPNYLASPPGCIILKTLLVVVHSRPPRTTTGYRLEFLLDFSVMDSGGKAKRDTAFHDGGM